MSDLNAHIPTVEVVQDIADTEAEIETMEQELRAWEALPIGSPDYLMAHRLRIPNRRQGIKDRYEFIRKLKDILEKRAAPKVQESDANE